MIDLEVRTAAKGIWLYDGTVPRTIEIHARPAKFAGSRFNDYQELDETSSIPDTPDGLVYYVGATSGGEFHTLTNAKRWADAQPWGPVKWE
jgi:hypothetical protein